MSKWARRVSIGVLIILSSLLVPAVGALGAQAPSYSALRLDELRIRYAFQAPLIEEDAVGSASVQMTGLEPYGREGQPMVPARFVTLALPAGRQVAGVRVVPGERTVLGRFSLQLAPTRAPLHRGTAHAAARTAKAAPFFSRLSSKFTVQNRGAMQTLVGLLFPVEYLPESRDVAYYKDLTLVVTLTPEGTGAAATGFAPSDSERKVLQNSVDNPDTFHALAAATPQATAASGSSALLQGHVDHVIITTDAFTEAFRPLAQWRESRGLASAMVTVQDIYANYGGRDPAEQVRNFINDAYRNNGTKYVLLGGDADGPDMTQHIVPARWLWASRDETDPPAIASDLYFGALDGSFDGNGNGIYGEPDDGENGEDVDLVAEVYVGRAPADSVEEVTNFVRKTLAYEQTPPSEPALKTAWMLGEKLDGASTCLAEVAVGTVAPAESQRILDTLRRFRDTSLKHEYVTFYYQHNNAVRDLLLSKPGLMLKLAGILAKHAPALNQLVRTGDSNVPLTEADVDELLHFLASVKGEIRQGEEKVGQAAATALLQELTKFEQFLGSLRGQTVGKAFKLSPYRATAAKIDEEKSGTWGSDYKDEVRTGSSNNGYTTTGFPSTITVNTLYDTPDYEFNGADVVPILNNGPHLINSTTWATATPTG